jgi:hypothetical protein
LNCIKNRKSHPIRFRYDSIRFERKTSIMKYDSIRFERKHSIR